MPDHPVRKTVRLRGYSYASPGAYFVMACTCDRISFLGTIEQDHVVLSPEGKAVRVVWRDLPRHFPRVDLDAFVGMPNHVHGIRHGRGTACRAPTWRPDRSGYGHSQ